MSKAQIALQECAFRTWLDGFAKQSKETAGWQAHKPLDAALAHFFLACPRDTTRTSCLLEATEYLEAAPRDLDVWAKWFLYPDFLKPLLPAMQRRWVRGDRILIVYNRVRLPFVPPEVLNKVKPSLQEKEDQHKLDLVTLDNRAGFSKIMTEKQRQQYMFTCKTCKRKGCVSKGMQQTRSADEGGVISEECSMCVSGEGRSKA